jgi:hypothetical protein
MVVERTFTDGLIRRLVTMPKPHLYLKHSDTFTSGIPDLTFSVFGATNWIEVKRQTGAERWNVIARMDQVVTGIQLFNATRGRAFFVRYENRPEATSIWAPRRVLEDMRSEHAVTCEFLNPREIVNFAEILRTRGIIRVPGFDHGIVERLIRDFDTDRRSCYGSGS